MHLNTRNALFVLMSLVSVPALSRASESILKAGNGRVCQTERIVVDQKKTKFGLCVTSAMFAHDKYALTINRKAVVEGIDDQTTTGVSGRYQNHTVDLKCKPQLLETRGLELDKTPMSVETGRKCQVLLNGNEIWTIQVQFD